MQPQPSASPRASLFPTLAMVALFLSVAGLLSYRTYTKLGSPAASRSPAQWALCDFRVSTYYPVLSFLSGGNPYDAASYLQAYPVDSQFPPYLPHTLLVHLPLGLVEVETAQLVHHLLTIALTLLLARLSLQLAGVRRSVPRIFGLAALLLLSRPGHWNLLLGQPTVEIVIGAYLALYYARDNHWLAGFGLALSMIKPTFGIPLVALMLARRDTRATLIGLAVTAAVSGIAVGFLVHAAGGLEPFVASLIANYTTWTQQITNPAQEPALSDALTFVNRLLWRPFSSGEQLAVTALIIGAGSLGVNYLATRRTTRHRRLSSSLICLAVVTCVHHVSYDALLLAFPTTALVADTLPVSRSPHSALRWILLGLLAVPFVNYLASHSAIEYLGTTGFWYRTAISLNGGALLAAFVAFTAIAIRRRTTLSPASQITNARVPASSLRIAP